MLSFFNVQAGLTASALCLGGFGIAAAVALVTAPITPRLAVAKAVDAVIAPQEHATFAPKAPVFEKAVLRSTITSRPVIQPISASLID